MGNWRESRENLHLQLKLQLCAEDNIDQISLSNIYQSLGRHYLKHEQFQLSLDYYNKAIEIKSSNNPALNFLSISQIKINMGVIFISLTDF